MCKSWEMQFKLDTRGGVLKLDLDGGTGVQREQEGYAGYVLIFHHNRAWREPSPVLFLWEPSKILPWDLAFQNQQPALVRPSFPPL